MDANSGLFGIIHHMGEYATHPLARPAKRLALSLLLAYPGRLRTRRGQAVAVKSLKRQQPRSRRFAPVTRLNAPSGASNYGF